MSHYLTNSERGTYRQCPRKWYYNYELQRITPYPQEPLFFGSAIGLGLDAIWEGKEDYITPFKDYLEANGFQSDDKKDRMLTLYYWGVGMLDGYKKHFNFDAWELVAVEHQIEWEVGGGITLRGMIDKVIRNKETGYLFVLDHKTTSMDVHDMSSLFWTSKAIDPQLVGYSLALEQEMGEPVYMIYDAIKKHGSKGPKLKAGVRKKKDESEEDWAERKADNTESWEEYAARVHEDYMTKPERYYKTGVINRNNAELEEWKAEFLVDAACIFNSRFYNAHPKVASACSAYGKTCEYLAVCSHMDSIDSNNFITKENRHPELDGREAVEKGDDIVI
jgi:hypothetical protein